MSHILDLKFKYHLIINVDKQLIFDGPDPERPWFSSIAMNIKLVDEENKEIFLDQQQKDEIISTLSKIGSINGN
jgi:hypothetical protein